MDFRERGGGGMDWIDLAQDRDWCRALVSTVINFWVPQNVGNIRVAKRLVASQNFSASSS
jgi:hypothetical protein